MKLVSNIKKNVSQSTTIKSFLLVAITALISACSLSDIKPDGEDPAFYVLNKDNGDFCQGFASDPNKTRCKNLVPTNFHIIDTQVIENIYQQQISGPNRVLSLMNIILAGDNIDYRPQPLNSGFYKLPMTQQTDTVWDVLLEIEEKVKRR